MRFFLAKLILKGENAVEGGIGIHDRSLRQEYFYQKKAEKL